MGPWLIIGGLVTMVVGILIETKPQVPKFPKAKKEPAAPAKVDEPPKA